MCVSNEDSSPTGIYSRAVTRTPTGFAEIVSNYSPVLYTPASLALQTPTKAQEFQGLAPRP
jgi:hypothetical protein